MRHTHNREMSPAELAAHLLAHHDPTPYTDDRRWSAEARKVHREDHAQDDAIRPRGHAGTRAHGRPRTTPVRVSRPDPWHTSTPCEGTDHHGDPTDEYAASGANLTGGRSGAPYPGDDLPW